MVGSQSAVRNPPQHTTGSSGSQFGSSLGVERVVELKGVIRRVQNAGDESGQAFVAEAFAGFLIPFFYCFSFARRCPRWCIYPSRSMAHSRLLEAKNQCSRDHYCRRRQRRCWAMTAGWWHGGMAAGCGSRMRLSGGAVLRGRRPSCRAQAEPVAAPETGRDGQFWQDVAPCPIGSRRHPQPIAGQQAVRSHRLPLVPAGGVCPLSHSFPCR